MRILKTLSIVATWIAVYALPLCAAAQPKNDAPPPPQMEKLEEGEEPTVTIRKQDQKSKIEEKRAVGGKVTEVQVTTGGNNTYYLKANDSVGDALPGDQQSSYQRAAQWKVYEFDTTPTPDAREAAEAAATEAPPQPAQK